MDRFVAEPVPPAAQRVLLSLCAPGVSVGMCESSAGGGPIATLVAPVSFRPVLGSSQSPCLETGVRAAQVRWKVAIRVCGHRHARLHHGACSPL